MNETLSLPARFDSAAVPGFIDAMKRLRGQPVSLDGARVEFAGSLALQALIACYRQWGKDGMPFVLSEPSQSLFGCSANLGISPADFGAGNDMEIPA